VRTMTEDRIVREINALNQRGGRMLSAIDLLAAGTLDLRLTAYLMRAIRNGASILACAGPGGTGKTTLMGALLCFLPTHGLIKIVEKSESSFWYEEQADPKTPTWFLCHELGPGPWYSYLWGEGAKAFLSMPNQQRFCATTVHADDLGELRRLLQGREIGISHDDFAGLDLILFIRAMRGQGTGRWQRRVTEVCVGTGDANKPHKRICHWDPTNDRFRWQLEEIDDPITIIEERPMTKPLLGSFRSQPEKRTPTPSHIPVPLRSYYEFLHGLKEKRITAMEDVRREVVRFYGMS
jgi:hypothetical protein